MAGMFEVFVDGDSNFRFRLRAPDGAVVADSAAFSDKAAAVAGIAAVRECAGTGLVTYLCPEGRMQSGTQAAARPGAAPQARHHWHWRGDGFHTRAGAIRRATTTPRWNGAA
nr:DUF1508 domain-containing protein [Arthrobacter sp. NicSoilB4]